MSQSPTVYRVAIPPAIVTIYRRYEAEYRQSDATFQALLALDRRGDLKPYELRLLNKSEDDCIFNKGAMRRLEKRYPGIQQEAGR
jgi:hypothetical protein